MRRCPALENETVSIKNRGFVFCGTLADYQNCFMNILKEDGDVIGHFRVPKTLTFKMRPSAQPFLWK